MEKIHETPKTRENMKDLEELHSLLCDIFGEQFINQINTIFQTPDQFQYLAKELINTSINHFITGRKEGIDDRLNLLSLEQKIEQSLEILGKIVIQKDRKDFHFHKTIPYFNSNVSYSAVLIAFLMGMKEGIQQYRNGSSPESINHIINT